MSERAAAGMQAVLLVGGPGTRLRPLTDLMPKALVPLLNRPLASYALELLGRAGVSDVSLAVSHMGDQLRAGLGDGSAWGVRVRCVEEPFPLGTAGAIKNLERHLEGDFLVFDGDLVVNLDLAALVSAHREADADLTIVAQRVEDVRPFGLLHRDAEGFVTAFREKVPFDETGQNTVNTGIYVMSRRVLELIPPGEAVSNEHWLFPRLISSGARVLGYLPSGAWYWLHAGDIPSYMRGNGELLDGALPWAPPRVESALPAGAGGPVCVGPDCAIDGSIGSYVTIGAGCVIEAGAMLEDCVLLDDARVGAGARVRGAIIGPAAKVPAGASATEGVYL